MNSLPPRLPTTLPACSAEKIALLTDMLNVSVDCIKVISTHGRLIFMNRSGCEALGISVDEKEFGMEWIALLPKSVHRKGRFALNKAVEGECSGFRGISILPDDTVIHWDNMLTPVLDRNGKTTCILCVSRNITSQVQAEEKLKIISERDPLTGLPNRRMLKKRLKSTLSRARRQNRKVGIMFIDLDDFKKINDTFGHAAGDKTLIQLSCDLQKYCPPQAFVSRLGGDEFAVIVEFENDDTLATCADHILTGVRRKVRFQGKSAEFSLSIGAAIFPAHGLTAGVLMRRADIAMYMQKLQGKNGFRLSEETNMTVEKNRIMHSSGP